MYEEIEEIITMQNVCGSRGEKMFVALKCINHTTTVTHMYISSSKEMCDLNKNNLAGCKKCDTNINCMIKSDQCPSDAAIVHFK